MKSWSFTLLNLKKVSSFWFHVSGFLVITSSKGGNWVATIHRFEDLEAWKIAREVTRDIYAVSRVSASRDFGLRDQICRASVSIMSNVAEGFERDGRKEFVNFLSIAKGSSGEVRSQLYVALNQNYITQADFDSIYTKCKQNSSVIAGLMKYLNHSDVKGLKFRQDAD